MGIFPGVKIKGIYIYKKFNRKFKKAIFKRKSWSSFSPLLDLPLDIFYRGVITEVSDVSNVWNGTPRGSNFIPATPKDGKQKNTMIRHCETSGVVRRANLVCKF